MSETAPDEARFSRPSCLPGVELVSVKYRERAFPEHSHAEWVVGAVMTGSEALVVGGMTHAVGAGQVLRLHPDELHANRRNCRNNADASLLATGRSLKVAT